ncbi:MAG: hypothetical protein RR555_03865 [Bacteroidales bacterium]
MNGYHRFGWVDIDRFLQLGAQGLSIKTARGIIRTAPSPKDSTNNSTPDTLRLIPLTVPGNHNRAERLNRYISLSRRNSL